MATDAINEAVQADKIRQTTLAISELAYASRLAADIASEMASPGKTPSDVARAMYILRLLDIRQGQLRVLVGRGISLPAPA